jgi:hypothetical protein
MIRKALAGAAAVSLMTALLCVVAQAQTAILHATNRGRFATQRFSAIGY